MDLDAVNNGHLPCCLWCLCTSGWFCSVLSASRAHSRYRGHKLPGTRNMPGVCLHSQPVWMPPMPSFSSCSQTFPGGSCSFWWKPDCRPSINKRATMRSLKGECMDYWYGVHIAYVSSALEHTSLLRVLGTKHVWVSPFCFSDNGCEPQRTLIYSDHSFITLIFFFNIVCTLWVGVHCMPWVNITCVVFRVHPCLSPCPFPCCTPPPDPLQSLSLFVQR